MALIKCPECGKENVSDSAESCPDCGYGIKAHFERLKQEEEVKRKEEAKRKQEEERRRILEEARKEEKQKRDKAEAERKAETLAMLQAKMDDEKKTTTILLTWSIIWTIIAIPSLVCSWNGIIIVIALLCAIIGWALVCLSKSSYNSLVSDYNLAKKNVDDYEGEKLRRAETAYKAAKINEARRQEEEALKHPKCPMCGSTNTQRISDLNRAVSVGTMGLASSKIGKQYECKKCKHKW